ncbi:class I SAM-dependent methyltransferase [Iamia majanohamensis]|uniref:Class I SAM-dependent methyltransferase n=1 Tax=Iamia majanohamensis TaxID=467976 RepID=A0AAE9Y4F1_9ACTN|nr:class I SAM-dependent methyltransferase [Iamia majanohamensis]WCO65895.1 class I SAM-dependent methyltransferase [Iamia majanohamensis]
MSGHRRAVLGAYRGCGPRARAHVALRWATAPLPAVVDLLPPTGRILDLGCGHGLVALLAAQRSPDRSVHAVDVDGAKLAVLRRAATASGLGGRVEVERVGEGWTPPAGAYDAVVVADVLYLLGRSRAVALLRQVAEAVRPGGTVVVKEVGSHPRWKARVNQVQERVAVGVLGITRGATVDVLPEALVERALAGAGLRVEQRRLDHLRFHPHVAFVGHRPPRPAT